MLFSSCITREPIVKIDILSALIGFIGLLLILKPPFLSFLFPMEHVALKGLDYLYCFLVLVSAGLNACFILVNRSSLSGNKVEITTFYFGAYFSIVMGMFLIAYPNSNNVAEKDGIMSIGYTVSDFLLMVTAVGSFNMAIVCQQLASRYASSTIVNIS